MSSCSVFRMGKKRVWNGDNAAIVAMLIAVGIPAERRQV